MKTEFGNERVARERDSWRWSVFPWFELECHTVDAKPLTCRPRSIRKHMAKVSFALLADNLRASCSQRGVHTSQDPCVTLIRARCAVSLRK